MAEEKQDLSAEEVEAVDQVLQNDEVEEVKIPSSEEITEVEEIDPIQALEAEKEILEERILRLQAEIANMQRINLKERQDAAKYRSQKLASEMVDVLDNLERAMQAETVSEDALALKKGVEMVYEQIKAAFNRENIQVIDPQGQPFDPNFHQAVSIVPLSEGQEADTIVQVLQKGYQLHERVLRPAMVIVAQ